MDLEKVAAAAKEYDEQQIANQEAAEREANKTIFDRIGDAVDSVNETVSEVFDFDAARNAFGETYNNGYDMNPTTPRPFGKLEDVAGDVVNAIQTANEKRVEFLHQGANMQEAYQQARETGDYSILEEQAETLRQSGRDASVAMTNVAASPFRQAARNFIASNADDNTSPFQGMAQSLQKSDVNLEYFMTSEEKLQKSREIEQELGLPAESTLADNEAYKAALDMYNFKRANDSIENVWEEYPELKEIAGMDKQAAAIALHNIETVRQTHGIIDSFTHFMERGNIKLEYDNLQYKIMRGEADSNDIQRAENLKKMMDDDKKKAPSFLDNPAAAMAAGVAQSLPEMSQGIKEGVKTAAPSIVAATLFTVATGGTGGAALLAGAGAGALRAALVRAVASHGVKSIGTRAFQICMFKGMAEAETGSRYAELGELKDKDGNSLLSENDRRLWAMAGGAANAGIEMLDFGLITNALKPTPHAARVFEDIIKNQALKKSQAEKTAELVGGRAKDWLKLTAAESGEEALQSAADDVIHNTAVASTGERGSNNKTYSLGEIAG
ncbi:MAG: hypothetical protein IIZ87_05290, partial [Selenomonas sp.]|nr:hypothetical protein [Selenomonas sp.]